MSEVNLSNLHSGFHADPKNDVCYRTLDFIELFGYRVGDDASVWSRHRHGRGTELSNSWHKLTQTPDTHGYKRVRLYYKTHRTHQLVLMAFVGPVPLNMEGCHNDGNIENNKLSNLRWGTKKSNQADRITHGTDNKGEKHHNAKLTKDDILEMRKDHEENGTSFNTLAEKYGISRPTASQIINRKRWTHI